MLRLIEFISNHPFLVSLFIAILALLLWNVFSGSLTGVALIGPADATFLMNRENAAVIDLRAAGDFRNGHILNAVNIPESELQERQKDLGKYKGKPVIACCQNGAVSGRVARTLRTEGFEKVYCLKGGVAAWQSANLPVARGTD